MAVIVMAFALTTSITVLQRGFNAVDSARNISFAAQMLQSELERVRLLPWSTLYGPSASTPTPYLASDASPAQTSATATNIPIDASVYTASGNTTFSFTNSDDRTGRFSMNRTVKLIVSPTATVPGLMQITLTMTWTNYDGHRLTRSIQSYYGQNGLYDYVVL